MAHFLHLASGNIGSKSPRIDRRAKILPEMRHRADVIFMRMRDENRFQLIFAFFQPSYIRQDQINARAAVHIWKIMNHGKSVHG